MALTMTPARSPPPPPQTKHPCKRPDSLPRALHCAAPACPHMQAPSLPLTALDTTRFDSLLLELGPDFLPDFEGTEGLGGVQLQPAQQAQRPPGG